ncbi:toxin-antitoxin system HicB family antitoxin, partial [Escherichia coli]
NAAGRSPTFQIRITPELREQLDREALKDGVSLANWLKGVARDELRRRGVTPKG